MSSNAALAVPHRPRHLASVPVVDDEEIARLPKIGDIVASKYRITELLGRGGMGVVFAGRHEALQQAVAIKFLRPRQAKDGESIRRFLREARAAASIRNARAARVFDIDSTEEGVPFIVMERLEGENVDRVLETRGAFAVAPAVDCILQACEALAEAHAAGLVHRDLKPSNLFLLAEPGGAVSIKVLDFGISKAISGEGSDAETSLTGPNAVLGSPQYMAPEQVMARAVDARTDIWALGAILFELLALRPPFAADSVPHLYALILSSPPTPLRALVPRAPAKLESVIARCLEKSPANRPADVGELAALLAPFASRESALSVARIRSTLEQRAPAPSSRGPSRPLPRAASSMELEPTQPAPLRASRVGGRIGAAIAAIAVAIALVAVWRSTHRPPLPSEVRAPSIAPSIAPSAARPAAIAPDRPPVPPAPSSAARPGGAAVPAASSGPPPAPENSARVRDLRGIKLLP